jgi:hypothetical protein
MYGTLVCLIMFVVYVSFLVFNPVFSVRLSSSGWSYPRSTEQHLAVTQTKNCVGEFGCDVLLKRRGGDGVRVVQKNSMGML